LLSPTLVVVVGALVASAYADGLWVPRVLAEGPEGPVEGVTSDCGPGCRDGGGGAGCRVPCQTDQDCECLYGPGWWSCNCGEYCEEVDYPLLLLCALAVPTACVACVHECVLRGNPVGCYYICPAGCLGFAIYCLYEVCTQWVYRCDCVRLPDNMPVGVSIGR